MRLVLALPNKCDGLLRVSLDKKLLLLIFGAASRIQMKFSGGEVEKGQLGLSILGEGCSAYAGFARG